MSDYRVDYSINVYSEDAIASIQRFRQAVSSIGAAFSNLDTLSQKLGKINAAFRSMDDVTPVFDVNTKEADRKLASVKKQLGEIRAMSKITLTLDPAGVTFGKKSTFSALRERIEAARRDLQMHLNKAKGDVAGFNEMVVSPNVQITEAEAQLRKFLELIKTIKKNSKINVTATVTEKPAAGTADGTNAAQPKPAPKPKRKAPSRIPPNQYRGTLLFPSTDNVLGPTYLNSGTNVFGEMVKGMGVAYGLGAVMSGITSVFTDAASYMNIVQTTENILGTHDRRPDFEARFDATNRLMRQVGADTRYTAPQVAEAGKFLAMAGYNVDAIQKSIRPIANIALVGDTDLGATADVVTNIMTSYDLDPARMGLAADVLTMTFTKTNTTLMELAESFKYAGTIAHQTGLSFEETSAAFGILGNAGIKGSQAGTTLRMMLLNMLNPTRKQKAAWEEAGVRRDDGHGNIRDLSDILADLNEVSKRMSDYDFTSLISRMFRITAAPGALALINSAAGVREVTALNYSSLGLSAEKALAKQNTTEGLWYQMTSKFTEAGMQGFEKMEGSINNMLRNVIRTFESQEFIDTLSNAMKMFLELVNALIDMTKVLANLWNGIPDSLKSTMVWFAKAQMFFGTFGGILKSFRGVFKFVKGIAFGSIFSPLERFLNGTEKLVAIYKRAGLKLGMAAFGRSMIRGGVGDAVEAAGGAAAGGNYSSLRKTFGKFSHLILPGFSTFGAAGMMMGGLALGGALIAATVSYNKLISATKRITAANKDWSESVRQLGIDKLDMTDPDSLILGNISIFNDKMLTHNQRIDTAIKLYRRFYEEKNRKPDAIKDTTPFLETEKGKELKDVYDYLGYWLPITDPHWVFNPLWKDFQDNYGASYALRENGTYGFKVGDYMFGNYRPNDPNDISKTEAFTLRLMSYGAKLNNPKLTQMRKDLLNILSSSSYENAQTLYDSIVEKYVTLPQKDLIPDYKAFTQGNKLSEEEYEKTAPMFYGFKLNADRELEKYRSYLNLFKDMDAGKNIEAIRMQEFLQSALGATFNTQAGLFGSKGWVDYIKDTIAHPGKHGFADEQQALQHVVDAFSGLLQLYNSTATKYRPYIAPFLNRTLWKSFMTRPDMLPTGGFIAGDNTNDTMWAYGQQYQWGLAPNFGIPQWFNDKGVFVPKNANSIVINPSSFGKENADETEGSTGSGNKGTGTGTGVDYGASRYKTVNSHPKQIIVRIENLMNVEKVDLTDERKAQAVASLRQELAQTLIEVVRDFDSNIPV